MYGRRGEAAIRHRAGERIVTQQWKGSDMCVGLQTLEEGEIWSSQSLEVALLARDLNVDSETVASCRSAADSNGSNSIEQG